jgi:type III pantothenate kinase
MGMVDGLIARLASELGGEPRVIATGGQAPLIRAGSRLVQYLDEDLTLKGLRLLWERN